MSSWRFEAISALGRRASRNPAQRSGPFHAILSATMENHSPSTIIGPIVTFEGCSGKETCHPPARCGSTETITAGTGPPSSSGT